MSRAKANPVVRVSMKASKTYAAIRTHPLKSCLYLLALPLAMSPLAIHGSIFAIHIQHQVERVLIDHEYLIGHGYSIFLTTPVVHFCLLVMISLGGNRLLFRKYCDVGIAVRRWLFGWHILAYCILPPFGWVFFDILFPDDPKFDFLLTSLAILSSGFYLMALVPALLLVNRVLGRD